MALSAPHQQAGGRPGEQAEAPRGGCGWALLALMASTASFVGCLTLAVPLHDIAPPPWHVWALGFPLIPAGPLAAAVGVLLAPRWRRLMVALLVLLEMGGWLMVSYGAAVACYRVGWSISIEAAVGLAGGLTLAGLLGRAR